MDVVVTGRNVEVPEHFRVHVSDKMAGVERYDGKVIRYEIELYHEKIPDSPRYVSGLRSPAKAVGPRYAPRRLGPIFTRHSTPRWAS